MRVPPELLGAEIHGEGHEGADVSLVCASAKHKVLLNPLFWIAILL